ncbi:MAG: hypothetical protein DRO09_01695, partial [Thermoprotei archaeon]
MRYRRRLLLSEARGRFTHLVARQSAVVIVRREFPTYHILQPRVPPEIPPWLRPLFEKFIRRAYPPVGREYMPFIGVVDVDLQVDPVVQFFFPGMRVEDLQPVCVSPVLRAMTEPATVDVKVEYTWIHYDRRLPEDWIVSYYERTRNDWYPLYEVRGIRLGRYQSWVPILGRCVDVPLPIPVSLLFVMTVNSDTPIREVPGLRTAIAPEVGPSAP